MMHSRFLSHLAACGAFGFALFLCLSNVLVAEEQAASGDSAATADANPKRKKMVEQFNRKLGRMKPFQGSVKSMDDLFLVGTAEVDRESGHADVCFRLSHGQKQTAEFLVDYIAESSPTRLRKWQVFYRISDKEAGEQALAYVRNQYDTATSYRTTLMKAYQAKSIRRC